MKKLKIKKLSPRARKKELTGINLKKVNRQFTELKKQLKDLDIKVNHLWKKLRYLFDDTP